MTHDRQDIVLPGPAPLASDRDGREAQCDQQAHLHSLREPEMVAGVTILELLDHTYLAGGFTTRCDFARENAELIGRLTFEGFLTTWMPSEDEYGNVWRVTPYGLDYLWREASTIKQAMKEADAATTH